MPSKYDEIIGLYDRTCTRLAESPTEWQSFLKTAGRNFRLRFDEQILLFAQRFDAIAVLEAEKWSGRFGRPLKDGATGIAVFTDPSASDERIKYYFDISDTQQSRTASPVPIWEYRREHVEAVQKALVDSFGATQRLLPQTLISAVENVTNDLLSDGGTPWDVDDTHNEAVRSFVAQSAAYMCLSRLGIEPEAQGVSITDVSLLSTQEGLYTVGEALHSVAVQVLSETARAIRAFNKQNRTIDSANHKGHNIAERNSERSVLENGRNESEKTGETQPRQVVDAETAVSARVAQTPVHRTVDNGRTGTAPGRRAEGSVGSVGEPVRSNVPEGGDHRGTESARPNGMGAAVQQPLQPTGRDRQRSDNLRVSWYDDWDEGKAEKSRSALKGQISMTENLAEEQSPAFVFEGKEQAEPTEEPTVRFDSIEFEKLIPHEMRFKEAHLVNGNEAFWVTQEPFTIEQLREFQRAVRTYDCDVKKFYVTPRDLSGYDFEEDLARNVLAVVTPDTMLKDDYVRAMQEEGLGDYLAQEAPAEQPTYDIGMGYLGNGLTVWNKAVEVNGDYQTIAHISPEGEISYRVSGLPTEVVETIERAAKTERQQARFIASYRRYAEIKHDNPDGIVLFQVGDFFEMYGADAQTASEALNLMLTSRAVSANERIPMCGIPSYELQHTINQLNQNNHNVVVAEEKNGSYSVDLFPASAAEQAKFSAEEFQKHIPHEMRFKRVDSLNDDTLYWVTQQVFGQYELEEFQKAVKDYGFEFKNFYVTVRDLSPHYYFDEDAKAGVLARVTPDLIDAEMYFNALRSEGIEIETTSDSLSKHTELSAEEVIERAQSTLEERTGRGLPPTNAEEQPKHNYQITDATLGEGGKKVKYRRNLNAINLLHSLERDGKQASPEAQEILSQYVGWGGIPEAFDQNNAAWATEFAELRAALTPEEYESARSSTLNAHYTSPTVIKAIYEAVGRMGFQAKKILEPAMGVGNFFGMLPAEMRQSELYGVELDSVSGRIAKQLYPTANITIAGYETTHYKDFFDLAVGNVPFGPYSVNDAEYNRLNFPIHDYFFAKMLDQVKPGGVIACVTSRYTMDKKSSFARQYIAARAELLGAIRLPNNAFKANAGTETVTDILFLQKREHLIASKDDWIYLGTMDGFTVNEYFVEHPEMVLGSLAMGTAQYGREELTVEPIQGASLSELLHQAVQNIHLAAAIPESIEELQETQDETSSHAIPADPTVRNFSFTERDGTIYYREDDKMSPQEFSVTQAQRIRGMIEIRDCVRELIEQEKEDFPDEQILETQARLNEMYDAYTKKYGLLNATTNKNLFHTDVSYPLLSSLETLDADGKLIGKSDVFTKRTIRPHIPVTHTNTGIEALAVSIGEKGRVDMEYMRQLTGKEESDIFEELKGEIFLNPKYDADPARQQKYLTADEYLSGNVREKLRDAMVAANLYGEYAVNVDALEKVIPKDLTAAEIEVRLGAAWLPVDVIQQFANELMENKWRDYHTIEFCKQTAKWSVAHKTHGWSDKECITYGTKRANFYEILEDTLNLRAVCVNDYVTDEDGKKKAVLNRKETEIARAKQETIKQAFRDWIWKDSTRRERLTRMYNEMFNSIRPREYDGGHLVLAGMNPEIQLKPYQRNAVARILYGGNTLLAHAVGAGKTFEMAAAAMELKRLGLSHKPMFVVPNHLTEQWASEFLRLYPAANVLVTTKKDFETANRKRFCSRIATGEWDAVIIGHSQFEKIPMSDEFRKRSLLEQREEIVDTLIHERASTNRSPFTVKELEGVKKRIDAELKELNSLNRKDSVITFEDLGVDRIFVDESHYFKNLYLYTKMRNVGGVASTSAQKTSDLYMKCRYLDELTGNHGTVFATGTPISNSMVELYTIQRYLQRDELKRNGFASFDSWASTFGETVDATELAPEGTGYRVKTRFARFFNLPELIAMFREVADIQTADMLDLPVPKANYHTINTQPSDIQKKLVESLADRAYDIRKGNVDSRVDNMLKVTSDGRKLALDQRLLNPMLPDYAGSKLNTCVENVYRIWDEGRDQHTTQLVFCDLSTPKNDGEFNVYDDVRNKLVAKGVPKEEIQFIHEAATEAKKTALFKAVQDGRVRILMGSTQKLGAGTNVQNRLVALHDLDVPWRPSDLEQRSGRIVRQGNENAEVDIYRYVTQGTFDAYLYQLVESKQRFVSQIMTSRSPVRSAEDVDEAVLSYAEIKMLATGDPRIKEKMDLDIQVQKLRLLKSNFLSEQYEIEDKIQREYPQKIESLKRSIERLTEDTETVKANGKPFDGTFCGMEINGINYSDKKGAGEALLAACAECTTAEKNLIGFYRGFNMALSFNPWEKAYILTLAGAGTYDVELGSDAYGNLTRIDHAIDRIPNTLGKTKELLKYTKQDLANAKTSLQNTFPQEAELADKQARLNELNAALDISSPAPTKKHPAAR